MDFNDFFKSLPRCPECGCNLEKAMGLGSEGHRKGKSGKKVPKGTVSEEHEDGPKHAGKAGPQIFDVRANSGHGAVDRKGHPPNMATTNPSTVKKGFAALDDFQAVHYVKEQN